MEGFEENEQIIMIEEKKSKEVIDKEILSKGSLESKVVVKKNDIVGREKIIKVNVRNVKIEKNVDIKVVERGKKGL